MQIAVGGCLAQKDRETILRKAPWVDAVFGTHNVGALPALLERARHNNEAQLEILESLEVFPSTLPTKRESVHSGWVSISVGCNNTCTFCIVPSLRGKERDRRPGEILAEIEALVSDGVIEVTLLGQNVNSYGVEFGDRLAFGKLLRDCGKIEGLERVRFTSPHLGILDKVREQIPGAAISTDIIVGFPGETEEDFQATLDVVERSRFATAFTFQYSKRPGTPAAELEGQLPKAVVQERFERLTAVQDRICAEENAKQIGVRVEVLVTAQPGRKSSETHRLSGRSKDQRLVHFSVPADADTPRPGDLVTVTITDSAAFHLVADPAEAQDYELRRSRAGDAWDRAQADSCGVPVAGSTHAKGGVLLGMPALPVRG